MDKICKVCRNSTLSSRKIVCDRKICRDLYMKNLKRIQKLEREEYVNISQVLLEQYETMGCNEFELTDEEKFLAIKRLMESNSDK
jgi:ribosomal protein S13